MATDQRFFNTGIAATSGGLYGLVQAAAVAASPLLSAVGLAPAGGKSGLEIILDQLDALRSRPNNIPGYIFRPEPQAYRYAKLYIFELYGKMGRDFPTPTFVLDGVGGIIIKWAANGHAVRLNCCADPADNYIYFENGDYNVEDDVTPETIKKRLYWLIQHEREPAG